MWITPRVNNREILEFYKKNSEELPKSIENFNTRRELLNIHLPPSRLSNLVKKDKYVCCLIIVTCLSASIALISSPGVGIIMSQFSSSAAIASSLSFFTATCIVGIITVLILYKRYKIYMDKHLSPEKKQILVKEIKDIIVLDMKVLDTNSVPQDTIILHARNYLRDLL